MAVSNTFLKIFSAGLVAIALLALYLGASEPA